MMNIPLVVKKFFQKFQFLHSIRFTQIMILTYGTAVLIICIVAVLAWDAYLFMQSITPIEPITAQESKKISLTTEEINEAISIIDQRQEKFTALLKEITSTTTISF